MRAVDTCGTARCLLSGVAQVLSPPETSLRDLEPLSWQTTRAPCIAGFDLLDGQSASLRLGGFVGLFA